MSIIWWDEIINHIISKCSKLTQTEYKIRLSVEVDPLGIVQEIKIWQYERMVCAKPRIRPVEWDIQNVWDYEIQIDPHIPIRKPDRMKVYKIIENLLTCGLCRPGGLQSENQRKEESSQRTKKLMEHEDDSNTSCKWCAQNDPRTHVKRDRRAGNRRTSRNHPH